MSRSVLIGEAAVALGVTEYQLRKACDTGVIDVPRAGRIRVFPLEQIAAYREMLRAAGLLPIVRSLAIPELNVVSFPDAGVGGPR